MNKLAIYLLFVLIFLGISRGLSTGSNGNKYIFNEFDYPEVFQGQPITIILEDAYQTGFVVKSNIHRYRVIRVFEHSEVVILQVSKRYFQKTLGHIGLSLFRRDGKGVEDMVAAPPGALFMGDISYGSWDTDEDGVERWHFFSAYEYLENEFFWGEFRPDRDFHQKLKENLARKKTFFGPHGEFGSEGLISQRELPMNWYRNRNKKATLSDYVKALTIPPLLRMN